MEKKINGHFTGERALYAVHNLEIIDSIFEDGESPLKESSDIVLNNDTFKYRYPIWYGKNFKVNNCTFEEETRAGCWYMDNVQFNNCTFRERKWFRKSSNITVNNSTHINGDELFWYCDNIHIYDSKFEGFYFCMNSNFVFIDNLTLKGKYSFQNCSNVIIKNSTLDTKDAFWDCENVEVYDSYIKGEYLGWNSKHLKFINCTIESLQGLCYIDDLELINCKLVNTSLSFELCSNIKADIKSTIDSVKNPISGVISCEGIGELILEEDIIDPKKTKINIKHE